MALIGEIAWYRGDSFDINLTIKAKGGSTINLTGYSFLFTVNSEQNPLDDTNEIFQVAGVIDPDQVTNEGKLTITPTAVQTNLSPADYFYDVQMTDDSGNIRTIAKDKFKILQDITKD